MHIAPPHNPAIRLLQHELFHDACHNIDVNINVGVTDIVSLGPQVVIVNETDAGGAANGPPDRGPGVGSFIDMAMPGDGGGSGDGADNTAVTGQSSQGNGSTDMGGGGTTAGGMLDIVA